MVNAFVSSRSPVVSAKALPDLLTQRMCLEAAEILCGVQLNLLLGNEKTPVDYDNAPWAWTPPVYRRSLSQRKHPCVLWAGEHRTHYRWLLDHFKALSKEYATVYNEGEPHSSFVKCYRYLATNAHRVPDDGRYQFPDLTKEIKFYGAFTHKEFLPYAGDDVVLAYKISLTHKYLYLYKRKHTWGAERDGPPKWLSYKPYLELLRALYGEPVNMLYPKLDKEGRFVVGPKV